MADLSYWRFVAVVPIPVAAGKDWRDNVKTLTIPDLESATPFTPKNQKCSVTQIRDHVTNTGSKVHHDIVRCQYHEDCLVKWRISKVFFRKAPHAVDSRNALSMLPIFFFILYHSSNICSSAI